MNLDDPFHPPLEGCDAIQQSLSELADSGAPLPDDLRAHLAHCEDCQRFADLWRGGPPAALARAIGQADPKMRDAILNSARPANLVEFSATPWRAWLGRVAACAALAGFSYWLLQPTVSQVRVGQPRALQSLAQSLTKAEAMNNEEQKTLQTALVDGGRGSAANGGVVGLRPGAMIDRVSGEGVQVRNLRVDYGRRVALHGLDLDVPKGEIFGLLGPNGAGKTTAFRAMSTLREPTHGEIHLAGRNARRDPAAARAILAYMPDLAPLPQDLRASEFLRYSAECHGLWGRERDARVDACLETVDLRERRRDFCKTLSLGMRQRLVLAASLLHQPLVLILDEPASGMDPHARASLREALRRQAARGATIILSSHVLSELQDLCTSVGLLQAGRLVDAGPLGEVLARQGVGRRRLRLRTSGAPDALLAWLSSPEVAHPGKAVGRCEVECLFPANDGEQAAFFGRVGAAGLGVVAMREIEASIEEVVLGLHQAGGDQ